MELPSRDHGTTILSRRNERSASAKKVANGSSSSLTPAPSSDSFEELDIIEAMETMEVPEIRDNGLPSPVTPANDAISGGASQSSVNVPLAFNSPSRKVSWYLILR